VWRDSKCLYIKLFFIITPAAYATVQAKIMYTFMATAAANDGMAMLETRKPVKIRGKRLSQYLLVFVTSGIESS
jgi:hypothetical protein